MIRKDNRNRDDSRGMRKESPRGKRTPRNLDGNAKEKDDSTDRFAKYLIPQKMCLE